MASKRKRDVEEDMMATPTAKQIKVEDVTRSGRVRKKPAKFVREAGEETAKTAARAPAHTAPIMSPPEPIPIQEAMPVDVQIKQEPVVQFNQEPVVQIKQEPVVQIKEEPVVQIKQEPVMMSPVVVTEDYSDDHSKTPGGRAGRSRKKSAKVLEMEEFEEAEKKQTKKDPGKKLTSPSSPVFLNQKKSQKATLSPIQAPAVSKILSTPIASLKIKDIPLTIEPTHPLSQLSPHRKSPIAATVSPKSPSSAATLSPVPDGKGSVIKLLLSSPAQSSTPVISASTVTQLSPPAERMPTASKKKKKEKAAASQQSSVGEENQKIKQALLMAQQSLTFGQSISTVPTIVKTETKPEGLKMKFTQIHKNTEKSLPVVKQEPFTAVPAKSVPKEPKGKKSKKTVIKDEGVFLPPPLPSPNVIHVGPMSMGLEVKSEPDVLSKKKKAKGKDRLGMGGAGMMDDEFGLDMSEIMDGEDSFMDIDDDDNLMIPEEEVETVKHKTVKAAKKKTGKSKGFGKLAASQQSDVPISDADLVMDLGRMNQNNGKKKKKGGKEKEIPEEVDKNLSKKKRAPTAYMLWCSANRTRVVADNPGIDFSTISKTLGEMWSTLSEKEKMIWKRKAKKAAGKGSTLITTGKATAQKMVPISQPSSVRHGGSVVSQRGAGAVVAAPSLTAEQLLSKQQSKMVVVDEIGLPAKGFGTDPVDVAAHLKIVGESLSIIGMRLQEHRGLIAVQGSLSVLLDSMLCAVAPLMCLTSLLPETDGLPQQTHMKNLDNIAYIMPGL